MPWRIVGKGKKGDRHIFPRLRVRFGLWMMPGATVYYFENDRIAGHWQIVDRLSVFQQLQQAASAH